VAAFERAVDALVALRRLHLSVVGSYLVTRGEATGTGSTGFGRLLGAAIANTSAAKDLATVQSASAQSPQGSGSSSSSSSGGGGGPQAATTSAAEASHPGRRKKTKGA
jgi:hypothetical protein